MLQNRTDYRRHFLATRCRTGQSPAGSHPSSRCPGRRRLRRSGKGPRRNLNKRVNRRGRRFHAEIPQQTRTGRRPVARPRFRAVKAVVRLEKQPPADRRHAIIHDLDSQFDRGCAGGCAVTPPQPPSIARGADGQAEEVSEAECLMRDDPFAIRPESGDLRGNRRRVGDLPRVTAIRHARGKIERSVSNPRAPTDWCRYRSRHASFQRAVPAVVPSLHTNSRPVDTVVGSKIQRVVTDGQLHRPLKCRSRFPG